MRNKKVVKHEHGTPNPIIQQEERKILAEVDQALESTNNPQIIGRNGEKPLLTFFSRYLPSSLHAVSGHFVSPTGILSPQIDIMIVDSRYPLLAENADGSVLTMLHSVIFTIEVKTRIITKDIKKIYSDTIEITKMAKEVKDFGIPLNWKFIKLLGFAYRSSLNLTTLEDRYYEICLPSWENHVDIFILRIKELEEKGKELGYKLHWEPGSKDVNSKELDELSPSSTAFFTPLSDLYYSIVQDAYYTLDTRNFTFGDIGRHIMKYMSWTTCNWNDLFDSLK